MRKLITPGESKLSKTIARITQDQPIEKSGFVSPENDKTIYYKTKSFRLRQSDATNLVMIVKEINKASDRKIYSDSEVIRGLINYISDNLEHSIKKLSLYVKNSSWTISITLVLHIYYQCNTNSQHQVFIKNQLGDTYVLL